MMRSCRLLALLLALMFLMEEVMGGSNSGSNVPILWGCNKNHYRRHHGYFSQRPSQQRHTMPHNIDVMGNQNHQQQKQKRRQLTVFPRGGSAYGTNNNVSPSSLSSSSPLVRNYWYDNTTININGKTCSTNNCGVN